MNFYLSDKPFLLGPAGLASIFGVYLVGAAVTPHSGRILDRIGYRRGMVWAAGIAAAGMLLTLIPWLPVIVVGLALGASGAFACQAAASSHVGKSLEGRVRPLQVSMWHSIISAVVSVRFFPAFLGDTRAGLVAWR